MAKPAHVLSHTREQHEGSTAHTWFWISKLAHPLTKGVFPESARVQQSSGLHVCKPSTTDLVTQVRFHAARQHCSYPADLHTPSATVVTMQLGRSSFVWQHGPVWLAGNGVGEGVGTLVGVGVGDGEGVGAGVGTELLVP
jgi:hypothetical protein